MGNQVFTALWMWLTPAIALALPLWFLMKSGYLVLGKGCPSNRWWTPNLILGGVILACVYYQAEINGIGWKGDWLFYAGFEFFGSWLVGLILLCCCQATFDAKHEYLKQKFEMGVDPAEIGAGKYVVRLCRNRFSGDGLYNLELLQTVQKSDATGDYVVFHPVYTFSAESRHYYTKERITKILKDYFDSEEVFTVEGDSVIVQVNKKPPQVIVIP